MRPTPRSWWQGAAAYLSAPETSRFRPTRRPRSWSARSASGSPPQRPPGAACRSPSSTPCSRGRWCAVPCARPTAPGSWRTSVPSRPCPRSTRGCASGSAGIRTRRACCRRPRARRRKSRICGTPPSGRRHSIADPHHHPSPVTLQELPMSRRASDPSDDELHALIREAITRRGFLRRSALSAGGLVLGNSLLAACGGGGKGGAPAAGADSAVATGAHAGKTLRISNWPLYIDEQTVPDFEKATGAKVEYTEDINDNGEFFAKIDEPLKRNQSIDRDIIVMTDWMAGRLIKLGYVAPLNDAKFPNKANLV